MKVFLLLLLLISTGTLLSMQNPYEPFNVAKVLNAKKHFLKEKFKARDIKSNFHPSQNFSTRENSKPPRKNNNKKSQDQYTSIRAALDKEFSERKKFIFGYH